MHGRLLFLRGGIIDVLDAVSAENNAPVGFGLVWEFGQDGLIGQQSFIEFVSQAQRVRAIKKIRFLFGAVAGNGLLSTAKRTGCNGLTLFWVEISTAHLALVHCHG